MDRPIFKVGDTVLRLDKGDWGGVPGKAGFIGIIVEVMQSSADSIQSLSFNIDGVTMRGYSALNYELVIPKKKYNLPDWF